MRPATAADIENEEPGVGQIVRIGRSRQSRNNGIWQEPQTKPSISSSIKPADASPRALLALNRELWGIEIIHRDKDVILGEEAYTNHLDNAPANVFSLLSLAGKYSAENQASSTRAIEYFQDVRNSAVA